MEYTNDGCLNLVIQTYYQNNSFSKDKNDKIYYMKLLEKDMLFFIDSINKRLPKKNTSLKIIQSCPIITESFEQHYPIDALSRVKLLWDIMDDFQKQKLLCGHIK